LLCRPGADTEPVLPASRPNAKNQNHQEWPVIHVISK
jgi:hypothetical protein